MWWRVSNQSTFTVLVGKDNFSPETLWLVSRDHNGKRFCVYNNSLIWFHKSTGLFHQNGILTPQSIPGIYKREIQMSPSLEDKKLKLHYEDYPERSKI